MAGLQSCQDPAEATQLFPSDGVGDLEDFAEAEVSQTFITPTYTDVDSAPAKYAVQVQAYPWTEVATDDIVSEIISQFFIDRQPLVLPIVNFTKFVEEMKMSDPSGATCCSPLLVNAICAHQCVSYIILFFFPRGSNFS